VKISGIESVTRTVWFASAADFVRLTFVAATAVMPDEIKREGDARDALSGTIARDLQAPLLPDREGANLAVPLSANIALA
jgi:hypothetical protein